MPVAAFISYLSEPMLVFLILAALGGWHAGLRGTQLAAFGGVLFVFTVVVFIARMGLVRVLHTNWDVSDRKKRVWLLLLLLGFCVLFTLLLWFLGNQALVRMSVIFLIWLIGFFLITLKVKISGHLGGLTLLLGFIHLWYGGVYSALWLLVPLVAWSRLVLKRHSLIEIIGGTLYSAFMLIFASPYV